ncbi:hypothetical protein [Thiomicrorhabdus xiamenensis]|uniref:Uncharacterized protein n=1 Tax=Thiomicrorhabdus xiamenensis TaxID=2739063 RepID=A0A7D4NP74_9GAMM|nr:hypothetical protein [Thiomicrorhabdus xiamenensis]QKI88271.1 hypothetical protein HQN79_01110 [Thiomicrorhabdus xiamenensis]
MAPPPVSSSLCEQRQNQHDNCIWRHCDKASERCICFTASADTLPGIDYRTVLIDLKSWDRYWQQDRCNYVPQDLTDFPHACCQNRADYVAEINMHRQKIERWHQQLQADDKVPAVCFEKMLSNGFLRIRQGRHRIAYLRQLDFPVFAAAIPLQRMDDFSRQNLILAAL